jgi:hypothetical protein
LMTSKGRGSIDFETLAKEIQRYAEIVMPHTNNLGRFEFHPVASELGPKLFSLAAGTRESIPFLREALEEIKRLRAEIPDRAEFIEFDEDWDHTGEVLNAPQCGKVELFTHPGGLHACFRKQNKETCSVCDALFKDLPDD